MSATPRGYAKDQAAGFVNRIEKVAIVGVRNMHESDAFEDGADCVTGWRANGKAHH
jgi:hypothetical protein